MDKKTKKAAKQAKSSTKSGRDMSMSKLRCNNKKISKARGIRGRKAKLYLLDFGAESCVPCREQLKILDAFEARNPDVVVRRYKLDREDSGADQMLLGEELQSVPTLIFTYRRKELERFIGTTGLKTLESAATRLRGKIARQERKREKARQAEEGTRPDAHVA